MIYRHREHKHRLPNPQRSRAKYRMGQRIVTLTEAVAAIEAGQRLYLGHKCQNPAWLLNMSLFSLRCFVRGRRCFYAIPAVPPVALLEENRERN